MMGGYGRNFTCCSRECWQERERRSALSCVGKPYVPRVFKGNRDITPKVEGAPVVGSPAQNLIDAAKDVLVVLDVDGKCEVLNNLRASLTAMEKENG